MEPSGDVDQVRRSLTDDLIGDTQVTASRVPRPEGPRPKSCASSDLLQLLAGDPVLGRAGGSAPKQAKPCFDELHVGDRRSSRFPSVLVGEAATQRSEDLRPIVVERACCA
jgi:hypothetical protein